MDSVKGSATGSGMMRPMRLPKGSKVGDLIMSSPKKAPVGDISSVPAKSRKASCARTSVRPCLRHLEDRVEKGRVGIGTPIRTLFGGSDWVVPKGSPEFGPTLRDLPFGPFSRKHQKETRRRPASPAPVGARSERVGPPFRTLFSRTPRVTLADPWITRGSLRRVVEALRQLTGARIVSSYMG